MNHKFRAMTGALALTALLLGAAGCSKEPAAQESLSTVPTLAEPQPTTSVNPAPSTPPTGNKVSYQHCGLRIYIPEGGQAAPSEEDATLFTFEARSITGTVRFGSLDQLGEGAASSEAYADLMVEKYGAESTLKGTGTMVAYYALRSDGDDRYMYSLYTYKAPESDTTVCWLVEAKGSKDDLQYMQMIVGQCGYNADQIPQL